RDVDKDFGGGWGRRQDVKGACAPLLSPRRYRMASRQRLVVRSDEFDVADAVDLVVIGNAGGATAESDLGPEVKVRFAAAFVGAASKRQAGAPLVNRKRPFLFGPHLALGVVRRNMLRRAFAAHEQQRSQGKAECKSARGIHALSQQATAIAQ